MCICIYSLVTYGLKIDNISSNLLYFTFLFFFDHITIQFTNSRFYPCGACEHMNCRKADDDIIKSIIERQKEILDLKKLRDSGAKFDENAFRSVVRLARG